ncbi:MAG: tetratricopeptide repeat protein [Thermoanaerobaculaceae bacterium]
MMRRALLMVAVLLVAAAAPSQDPLAAATEAYRQGDLPKAARLFAEAAEAEQAPAARAQIRVKLAWTHFAQKSRTKAEEALAAALADEPSLELDRDFYTDDFLALFEKVRKRVAAAGQPPARPTQLPAQRPPHATTPLIQLRQRLAQAADAAAIEPILADLATLEMLAQPSQLPEILEVKAETLDRLGRTSEALELRGRLAALRAAAQALPGTSAVPLDALLEARRFLASGRPGDAVSLLRGVLAAQPSSLPVLEVLAEAFVEAGQLDDAFRAVNTALGVNDKPELRLLLGEIELRRNRLDFAREAFRRVVETDFGNDRGWAALGLLAARSGDLSTARDALDKALRANPMLFEARVVRAQVSLLDGDASAAVQSLQRAVQARPEDPWPQAWLGMAHLAAGNTAAAAEKLDLAVKAGQDRFALALAEALRRQGNLERALQVLDRLPADDARVGLIRARCLLDARRPVDASLILRGLADADPTRGDIAYLLAYALHADGRWPETVALLDRAATLGNAPAGAAQARQHAEATRRAQELLNQAEVPPPPTPKR